MVHCAVGCFVCSNNQEGDTVEWICLCVLFMWFGNFFSFSCQIMNITKLAERLWDCPEEYSVLSVFKKEIGNHRG